MNYVLDASALLAFMQGERGFEKIEELMHDEKCFVSSVNMAEVGSKLVENGLPEKELSRIFNQFQVQVIDFNLAQAKKCSALRAQTRAWGMSLGDRACLGLAMQLQACAVTTDKIWSQAEKPLKIKVLQLR